MKCKNCGEELPERARFCYACGTPVEDVPAPKRLEEPLAAGAVPLVPLAPPPRAYRMESRAARAAARGDRRLARAVTRALGTDADESKKDAEPKEDELSEKDVATEAVVEETAAEKDVAAEAEPTVEKDVTSEVEEAAEQAPEAAEDVEAAEDAPEEAVEEEPEPEGADEADEPAVADDARESEEADEPEEEPEAEATEPEHDAVEDGVAADEPAEPEPAESEATEPELSAAEKTAAGATALLHRISEAASEDVIPAAKRGLSATKDTLSTAGEDLSAVGGRLSEYVKEMQGPRPVIIGIAVVALAVAIGALVWFGTSPLGPFAPRDENVPVVQPPSDGSIPPLEDDSEEAEEPAEEEPSELAPRTSVAEYSWDELSQVSALIAAAPSDEAVAIATEYHLCSDNGKLDGTQTKELELTDGTKVTVAVAGFRHDEKADGSGVAGVTFVTLGSIGKQAYNPSGDVTAWEDSPLRSWMNQSLMGELPEGLADLIVPVTKATGTPSGDLSETSDSMWLLSATELAGLATNGEEGSQYQLFSDQGVEGQSSVLKLCDDYWWLRGLTSDGQWQRTVDKDGSPSSGRNSLYEFDVVAGFCL